MEVRRLWKSLRKSAFEIAQRFRAGTLEAPEVCGFVRCVLDYMKAHAAEAAGVDEAQLLNSRTPPGAQDEHAVGVERAGHVGIGDEKAASHAEVHDPLDGIAFRLGREVEDDVLADAADALDGAAGERFGHGGRSRLHGFSLA